MSAQIVWAHTYDGYSRIAGGDAGGRPALAEVLDPCWREWRPTHRVPDWCGVDLLRAWAVYLARADRHGGGYALSENGESLKEWNAVLGRLASIPPPGRTTGHRCSGRRT